MSMNPAVNVATTRCSGCGNVAPAGRRFCGTCGSAMPVAQGCPHCGAALPLSARFCGGCGATVAPPAAPPPAAPTYAAQAVAPAPGLAARPAVPAAAPSRAMPASQEPDPALAGQPAWKSALAIMFNPGQVVRHAMEQVQPQFALGVSGTAFALLFLQTGLDLARTGAADTLQVVILAVLGALYGSFGVAAVAVIAWALTRLFRAKRSIDWTIRTFALGYSPALIYGLLGLAFNVVLGWNTAVAFGVTGVLWAVGPMIATLKEMLDGRTGVSIVVATVCGGLLLLGWAMLGA